MYHELFYNKCIPSNRTLHTYTMFCFFILKIYIVYFPIFCKITYWIATWRTRFIKMHNCDFEVLSIWFYRMSSEIDCTDARSVVRRTVILARLKNCKTLYIVHTTKRKHYDWRYWYLMIDISRSRAETMLHFSIDRFVFTKALDRFWQISHRSILKKQDK